MVALGLLAWQLLPATPAPTPTPSVSPVAPVAVPSDVPPSVVRTPETPAPTTSSAVTGGSIGHYTARKGDTLAMLAKRFHTTAAEIKRLNPDMGDKVEVGAKLKLKRRVVPNAKAWVA